MSASWYGTDWVKIFLDSIRQWKVYNCPQRASVKRLTVDFQLKLPLLAPGNYHFSPAVADGNHEEYVMCDWVENAISLAVTKKTVVYGYMKFDCQVGRSISGETLHVSSPPIPEKCALALT